MSPTGRAVGLWLLAALSCAWIDPLVAALIAVAIGAVVMVDALAARRPPTALRTVADVLARSVGTPLLIEVESPPGNTVTVRQPLPPDVTLSPSVGHAGLVGELVAQRRGRHVLGPMVTRSVGPLGLGRWDHTLGEPLELLVYPDLPAAQRLAHLVRTGRFRDPGLRARGPLGLGTDFEQIHDYTDSDDVRRINWRATERLGRPMANQYREDTEKDVVCLVDCGRLMAAPVDNRTRLDAALDAVAAVAAVADAVGDRCGTVAFHRDITRRLPPRRAGGEAVVRALFDLEPTPVDSDFGRAFRDLGTNKRSLVVVFTDLLDEAAARYLVEAVPVLARRHAVVVATVEDSDLAAALGRPLTTLHEVLAASVTADVMRARQNVAANLQRNGATVVTATPERLGAACVAAYLTLKSKARV